jgi:hypothetical protein
MPRFQSIPPISGLTAPDGTAFHADENGVFEIELNAVHLAAFQDHGIKLEMLPEAPVEPPAPPPSEPPVKPSEPEPSEPEPSEPEPAPKKTTRKKPAADEE